MPTGPLFSYKIGRFPASARQVRWTAAVAAILWERPDGPGLLCGMRLVLAIFQSLDLEVIDATAGPFSRP